MEPTQPAAEPQNRYAPPSAQVADVPPRTEAEGEPLFFPVSPFKLAVMSLCTFGMYEVFWFYWNWKMLKAQGHDVRPVWRAVFGIFFCHSMFREVRDTSAKMGIGPPLGSTALAWGWVICTLAWRAPQPFELISLLAFIFVLPVQRRVNQINAAAAPGHDPNDSFKGWNWLALALGGVLLVLTIIGEFLQPGKV